MALINSHRTHYTVFLLYGQDLYNILDQKEIDGDGEPLGPFPYFVNRFVCDAYGQHVPCVHRFLKDILPQSVHLGPLGYPFFFFVCSYLSNVPYGATLSFGFHVLGLNTLALEHFGGHGLPSHPVVLLNSGHRVSPVYRLLSDMLAVSCVFVFMSAGQPQPRPLPAGTAAAVRARAWPEEAEGPGPLARESMQVRCRLTTGSVRLPTPVPGQRVRQAMHQSSNSTVIAGQLR